MNQSMNTIVRGALARKTKREGSSIHAWHDLERDLSLSPAAVVRVVVDIETIAGIEVPAERLRSVRTVLDLVTLFLEAIERQHKRRLFDRVA